MRFYFVLAALAALTTSISANEADDKYCPFFCRHGRSSLYATIGTSWMVPTLKGGEPFSQDMCLLISVIRKVRDTSYYR
ncbi:hypothetical protein EV702DRAFT_1109116 [Suillus placidus]|uniref:Uncharacterized protein n=1 Tax=Suillus placidus TaxID=48579 RepID=A0A9P6ZUN9_9AGAM|nr:hypothetical protein EV702DRAFT_1109116 [Suillus placidus]